MSFSEIFFILFIVLIVFGADKIPEIARGLGKGMRQLRDATNEIKSEIKRSAEQNNIDTSVFEDTKNEIDKVKEEIQEATSSLTGSVKRQR
ncbi:MULTISPECIES: Sec-independent protein translocase subunit TatA/TatB [Capnocytophaga]|uniref:Sec-independent protein translocase protein TatA n=1 Tax=Capnocytophaga canis TaxID=1848903 RepID=A0A0B7IJZ2_9FLAO|nr:MULTISPECIES: twin-arginine translocase TatA/TatE family subunit [Capnocytophaga]ATA72756.1 twin-arginine translocase TatA/TatE family subunit [Capnocytophaga sp. H4358]ATA74851.1 twin-arginine translocase TatA/TatE family subunit [Capnocytophaga sp. H2931]RIY35637.1 twin-arginine translocase TatA/TatE family subunit [Capnocytophaga canis]CEN43352.1 Sec-independent protein translocase protein TatA [Capnocytophaga canis]CEN44739.1 Sec-independent protein translocase protein TatA [Capnocytoph